jgi:enamine deaminase RidA (YjgF/YER057c/UK114 family)
MREAITTPAAPAAIGPYSQAIRIGYTVFLSGQIGLDPANGYLVEGLEPQTHQVFRNLRAVMQAAGVQNILTKSIGTSNPHNVIHATVDALQQLRSADTAAGLRGKTLAELQE